MNYQQKMYKSQETSKCQGCTKFAKLFKIATSDYDFQIKKMQEDRSTQKALFEINMMKQIRKLNEKNQKQKKDHELDNKSWMEKYDNFVKENQQKIYQIKQASKRQVQAIKDQQRKQFQLFKKSKIQFYQNELKQLKQQHQHQKTFLQENKLKQLSKIQTGHLNHIEKLQKSYKDEIKRKSDAYDTTILGLKSQLKAEQNLHSKTKQQSKNMQSNLLQEIYSQKKMIFQLQDKIRILNQQIQDKSINIQTLKETIQKNLLQFEQRLQNQKDFYLSKEEQNKTIIENQIKEIYRKQLQDCDKYQSALIKINEHRQNQTKMYQKNIQNIKSCIEDRPSRLEDIQEIIQFREKLYKKQKQCENYQQQLRWYRLQLENKEDVYNKIFGPNHNNQNNNNAKKKQIKLKRAGRSVTTVRQILNTMNSNHLAPLAAIDKIDKKNLPPRSTKIL